MKSECPDPAILDQYLSDVLPSDSAAELIAHVDACPACQKALDALTSGDLPVKAAAPMSTEIHPSFLRRLGQRSATPSGRFGSGSNGLRIELVSPNRGPDLPKPKRVGAFEILDEIGRGGMGVVYKARQDGLNRMVAIKMIRASGSIVLEERIRFRMEAEAVAQLQHPNIVQIHEIGEYEGRPYLVFELVEGGALDRLGDRAMAARDAAELVETLARAVHFAHSRGIIHRDLKPANILIAERGTADAELRPDEVLRIPRSEFQVPKITDFGLAKRLSSDAWKTQEGSVLGTPAYMAPEQASGSAVGPPADLYALGVMLYEFLTGRVPFLGKDSFETLTLVCSPKLPTPPRRHQPKVPRDLETICLKCLEKEPNQRYATAQHLADDLRRFLNGEPILARPAGIAERTWKWIGRNPIPAALAATTAALVVTVAIVSTVAAVRLQQQGRRIQHAEYQHKIALVDALLTTAPDTVPFLIKELEPATDLAIPNLRERFADQNEESAKRLRAAVGLTVFGEPQLPFLLDAVPTAPAAESRNLALAFRSANSTELRDTIAERAQSAANLTDRARYAILLLDLHDERAAKSMLAAVTNPAPRTVFLDEIQAWHGNLEALAELLSECKNSDCRSGLCAAVGRADPTTLTPETRQALAAILSSIYQTAPDGGTHAAAEWALRKWKIPLPPLASSSQPVDLRHWFHTETGLTMIRVGPGAFYPRGGFTVVARPYFLSDREVPVALFRQFVNDPNCPPSEKPTDWLGPIERVSPQENCPVNGVNRLDMILFCNWLSARDGRRPCYQRSTETKGGWAWDRQADGFRLPTESEWDYAHRAGAITSYFFGDDPQWLPLFAHVSRSRTAPGGSYMPNRWGLFDMVGNLWELCWDHFDRPPSGALANPNRVPNAESYIAHGGAFDSGSNDCLANQRLTANGERGLSGGFRVACGESTGIAPPKNHDALPSSLK